MRYIRMASKPQQPKQPSAKENRKDGTPIKPIDPADTDSTFECPACINVPNVVADDEMKHILTAPTVSKRAKFVEHEIIAERKKDHRHNSEYLVDSVPVWRSQHGKKDKLKAHNLRNCMVKKWYAGQRPEYGRTKEVDHEEYSTMIVLKDDPRVNTLGLVERESSDKQNNMDVNMMGMDEEDFGFADPVDMTKTAQPELHVTSENREDGQRMKKMLQHILSQAQDERAWTAPLNSKQYSFASRLDERKAKYIDGTIKDADDLVLRGFDQEETKVADYSGINIIFEGKISNQKAEEYGAKANQLPSSQRDIIDASSVWSLYFDVQRISVDEIICSDRQFGMHLANQIIEKAPHSLQFTGKVLPLIITLVPRAEIDQILDRFNISRDHQWYERRIFNLLYNLQKSVFKDMPYLEVMRIYVDLTNMLHRESEDSTDESENERQLLHPDGYGRSYQQISGLDEEGGNTEDRQVHWEDTDRDEVEPRRGTHSTGQSAVKSISGSGNSRKAATGTKAKVAHSKSYDSDSSNISVSEHDTYVQTKKPSLRIDHRSTKPNPNNISALPDISRRSIEDDYETNQAHASGTLSLMRQHRGTRKQSAESTLEDGGRKKRRQ